MIPLRGRDDHGYAGNSSVTRGLIVVLVATAALAQGPGPVASTGIRFEEIAAKSGLNFITSSSPTPNKNQIETMGQLMKHEFLFHQVALHVLIPIEENMASIPEIETLRLRLKKGKSQKTLCRSIVSQATHFIKIVLEFML